MIIYITHGIFRSQGSNVSMEINVAFFSQIKNLQCVNFLLQRKPRDIKNGSAVTYQIGKDMNPSSPTKSTCHGGMPHKHTKTGRSHPDAAWK